VELTQGDVTEPSTLAPALEGVHTAYYLIHNMSSGRGYTERELEGARNFARAAENAGVRHIVYLGGLADPEQHIAPHLRSRIETGAALRTGKTPVTEFRAGVIAGSGSISFEMIRFMTELFPVIPAPVWVKNKSQPIATQNVVDYLLAALDNWSGHGQVLEIGGPEITTYRELMLCYARARGLNRRFLLLPYIPVWFMAFGIGLTTPVPGPIAHALVGGLSSDSIVLHNDTRRIYPEVNLVDFESVVREALTRLHPHRIERVWGEAKASRHEGFFIDQSRVKTQAAPEMIFSAVKKLARQFVIETAADDSILARLTMKLPGEAWLEWKVESSCVAQTVFFTPRGSLGFFFWHLLRVFHLFIFQRLKKSIPRNSVVK